MKEKYGEERIVLEMEDQYYNTGLPTPNIFTGGENFHGKYEYISVENMEKATQVIVEIASLFEKQA